MKTLKLTLSTLLTSLLVAAPVYAHDPSAHKMKTVKPNCQAMKKMDHGKMDMNDPVMMAMMKKCMGKKSSEKHHVKTAKDKIANGSKVKKVEDHSGGHNH